MQPHWPLRRRFHLLSAAGEETNPAFNIRSHSVASAGSKKLASKLVSSAVHIVRIYQKSACQSFDRTRKTRQQQWPV